MSDQSEEPHLEAIRDVAEVMPHAPVAPAHGIAAIALSMSLKYHNINTVQDGALYQQYKLEGKNMSPLHLDMVLETAERLEKWLIGSQDRIAAWLMEAIEVAVDDDDEEAASETKDDADKGSVD